MNKRANVVYTPQSVIRQPGLIVHAMLRDLWGSHELAKRLALRDLKAQYRQSLLGVMWAVLLPLANTFAWIFLHRAGIVDVAGTGVPYGLYVFSGALLWSIFTDAINSPLQQTLAARAVLVKINFPREALVLAGIYQTCFHALIKIGLVLVVLAAYGYFPRLDTLLVPLATISLILAGTAIGLILTPAGVLYGDVGRALPLLTQLLIFVTPVAYPIPAGGWTADVMSLNPMTPLIEFARNCLLPAEAIMGSYFYTVNFAAFLILLITLVVYRIAMPILIERMGSQA